MTPELREKWAAALESGEYVQAQGVLRNDDKEMCCLGVLCEIVSPASWRRDTEDRWSHRHETTMPSSALLEEIGLRFMDAKELAKVNDDGHSFIEIAKLVRNLPEAA